MQYLPPNPENPEEKPSEPPLPTQVVEEIPLVRPTRGVRDAHIDIKSDKDNEEMWEKLIEEIGGEAINLKVYEKDELTGEQRYIKGSCMKYNPKNETRDQLIERIGNRFPDIECAMLYFTSPKTSKVIRDLTTEVRYKTSKPLEPAPIVPIVQQLPQQITVEMNQFKQSLSEITRTQDMSVKNQSDLLSVIKDSNERQIRLQEESARRTEDYLKEQNKQSLQVLQELIKSTTNTKGGGLEDIMKILEVVKALVPPAPPAQIPQIPQVDPMQSMLTSFGLITKIMDFTEEMRGRVSSREDDEQPQDDRRGFNVQRFIGSLESEISKVVGTGLGKTIQNQIAPIVSKIAIGGKTTNEEKVQPDAGRQLQSLLIEIEKRCSTQTPEEIVKWGKESGILEQITPEVIAGLKKTEWGIVRDQLGTIRPSILSHEPKLKKIVELL